VDKRMKLLADVLVDVVESLGSSPSRLEVIADWDELAPPTWRDEASPVRLEGKKLVVEVSDGATASVLKFRVAELIDSLNTQLATDQSDPPIATVSVIVRRSR
jgi:hypothetical protein